jgi:hypothetical protein
MGGNEMTSTQRTDVEEKEAAASRHHCGQDSHIEAGFARTLERELNEVREQLRTARANAFEEASDLAFDMGEPSTAYALKNKSAAIRAGS